MSGSGLAAFLLGLIVGALLLAWASDAVDADRIKAGAFERDGVAYRITPLGAA